MDTMDNMDKSVNLNSKLTDGSKKKNGQTTGQNAFKYGHQMCIRSGLSAVKRSKWCWCPHFVSIVGVVVVHRGVVKKCGLVLGFQPAIAALGLLGCYWREMPIVNRFRPPSGVRSRCT